MLEIEEYKLDGYDTRLTEDEVISHGEVNWFRRELERVAGKNQLGGLNLELRWGPTYEDPMSADRNIKYLDFVQKGLQLGERRWFIEIWRSPEFLKRSGRYQKVNDPDTVQEFYFCQACDTEIKCTAQALEMTGSVPPCPKCNSSRVRTEMVRERGSGRLLNEFPSRGCYDYWLRLERANFSYHAPDNEMLKVIRALWEWELIPQNKRDELESADREIERRMLIQQQRQQGGRMPQFGSGLILPAHLTR